MTKKKDELPIKFFIPFFILWIVGALLSLGLTATIIWAIVKVVMHFAG